MDSQKPVNLESHKASLMRETDCPFSPFLSLTLPNQRPILSPRNSPLVLQLNKPNRTGSSFPQLFAPDQALTQLGAPISLRAHSLLIPVSSGDWPAKFNAWRPLDPSSCRHSLGRGSKRHRIQGVGKLCVFERAGKPNECLNASLDCVVDCGRRHRGSKMTA